MEVTLTRGKPGGRQTGRQASAGKRIVAHGASKCKSEVRMVHVESPADRLFHVAGGRVDYPCPVLSNRYSHDSACRTRSRPDPAHLRLGGGWLSPVVAHPPAGGLFSRCFS